MTTSPCSSSNGRPDRIQAVFVFEGDLSALLPYSKRAAPNWLSFQTGQSCKHLIESLGIPHTEFGAILRNGEPGDSACQPRDLDRITVLPALPPLPSSPEPGFVLDGHLGRLCAALRMLGLDCLYRADAKDEDLVAIQKTEQRVLLTRDRRLLMRNAVTRGALVRSLDPDEQLDQIVRRFDLQRWTRPFQRCLRCNTSLISVQKTSVLDRLQPLTQKYFDDFKLCPACDQIFWRGSHYEHMLARIAGSGSLPAQNI